MVGIMQNSPTDKHRSGHRTASSLISWLLLLAGLAATATIGVTAAVIGAYHFVTPGLPAAEAIRDIPLQIPLRIFSRDGRLIEEIGERRRFLVTYDEIPQHVVNAFIAAEDRRFFEHPGVDYQGILRAGFRLMVSGRISGGGSTLTQQLARDYFLSREQVFTRKVREAFLAYKIEQEFTKREIMALFVNKMFFGQRAYGVAAAAQVYFGKNLSDINEAEAATLAGVLPAPSEYNPVRSPANARMRRNYVLGRMFDLDFIDRETHTAARDYPLVSRLHGTANELSAPYVAEMVRREMVSRFGEDGYDAAGYKVVTTLDSKLQRRATYALRNGLLEFTRRRGYREPIASLEIDPALFTAPYATWPDEIRVLLDSYGNPGGLQVALVTALNDDDSASIMLQSGERTELPWYGISWARPFIDVETRGPAPETVADVLTPGDVIYVMPITIGGYALTQLPEAQSAVVSIDPYDGAKTSLAGGLDFSLSKFNRGTQAVRQPGSSFNTFIYSAAIEHGYTAETIILDAPVVISSAELEAVWRPVNYSGRFYGEQRMREALVRSMNLASVRLLINNTGIGNAVRHLAPFGFNDNALPRNGSLALGGGNATPLDMVQAYATFANGGYAVNPYVIDSITGPNGEILYRAEPLVVCPRCEPAEEVEVIAPVRALARPLIDPAGAARIVAGVIGSFDYLPDEETDPGVTARLLNDKRMTLERMAEVGDTYRPDATTAPELFENIRLAPRIISPQNAFLIQDMMRDVVRRGTGIRARQLGRRDLSGKTGTSNDRRDAWFAGFQSDIAAVVWVGYDNDRPLGPREEGSRTALPIWIEFMRVALDGVAENPMPMPNGLVTVRIVKSTGCPANFSTSSDDVTYEIFREENLPEFEFSEDLPDIFNLDDDLDSVDEGREEEPLF
jgi:penicillin-binding protein 1A